jgi:hypothetical protein
MDAVMQLAATDEIRDACALVFVDGYAAKDRSRN